MQYKEIFDKREDTHIHFLRFRKQEKKKLLYMNFIDWHMPKRTRIQEYFKDKPFCTSGQKCPFKQYIKEAAAHKFILSPPGLGPDCYRVWESLLIGTIPIVEHSHLDYMYEGLPVLFIDNWEEVTEDFLQKKYTEITSRSYNPERLYMEYWIDYIKHIRKQLFPARDY